MKSPIPHICETGLSEQDGLPGCTRFPQAVFGAGFDTCIRHGDPTLIRLPVYAHDANLPDSPYAIRVSLFHHPNPYKISHTER